MSYTDDNQSTRGPGAIRSLISFVMLIAYAGLLPVAFLIVWIIEDSPLRWDHNYIVLGSSAALVAFVSALEISRVRKLPISPLSGFRVKLALGMILYGVGAVGFMGFVWWGAHVEHLDSIGRVSAQTALKYMELGPRAAAVTFGTLALVFSPSPVTSIFLAWFDIRKETRERIFNVIDVLLLIAFALVTVLFPLQPVTEDPAALVGPVIRMVVTVLFLARLVVWVLPWVMDLVELISYETMIAVRHLRARKSSFLAAIGGLAILAVASSSCSLTTTLSVMGGFRNDLKRKILGNHAHVVVDRERGNFAEWRPTLEAVQNIDGVEGASPYVGGEVMITSSTNLAGAVLRGIKPHLLENVTDLEGNMTHGRLQWLVRPEELVDLPAEVLRGAPIPLAPPTRQEREGAAAPGSPSGQAAPREAPIGQEGEQGAGLVRAMGNAIGEIEARENKEREDRINEVIPDLDGFLLNQPNTTPAKPVLPGVVLGRELARTLRVFVGDDVTVVSPFGDLGPMGPMPKSRPFRVAGIFYSGMYEYDMKHAYVMLEAGQRFLNTGEEISGIEIKVADAQNAPAIAANVRNAIRREDELRVQDWQELNRTLFGALALEKLAMFITLGLAILVAGFCVFGTLTLMVQEKSRQVGILKAMGVSRRHIVGIFMLEGTLIGVFGGALGLGLGYIVTFAAEHFGVGLNPEVYYIDRLPVHVDPMEFLLVFIASATICLVATIFPAYLASRMRPVDALRFD